MSTLSSANVTNVNLVLKERTHMRLCINMLIFTHNLGNWLITSVMVDEWMKMVLHLPPHLNFVGNLSVSLYYFNLFCLEILQNYSVMLKCLMKDVGFLFISLYRDEFSTCAEIFNLISMWVWFELIMYH